MVARVRPVEASTKKPAFAPGTLARALDSGGAGRLRPRLDLAQPGAVNPFQPAAHPPKALPPKAQQIAKDSAITSNTNWAWSVVQGSISEGLTWLGFPYLAELSQRPEYRTISEVLAEEMTRKWLRFEAKGDDDKTDRINELNEEWDRLEVKSKFKLLALHDGLFGRAHLHPDFGNSDDRDEMATPIGDGQNNISRAKVAKDSLQRLTVVEPLWVYPLDYDTLDPLSAKWYNPQHWYVMTRQIHHSRLLTFVGRPVPDLLKPAYSFGGLSMSQLVMPYVNNWITTRQSVNDLIHAFTVWVLSTNLAESLQVSGDDLFKRMDLFNRCRDNRGIFLLDKDSEEFNQVNAQLGTLDQLQAQAQEHMACLPGDVLVETDRGLVPIKEVCIADKVMTRMGFAPLVWSGITGESDELLEFSTANSTVRATAWHPLYVSKINEFVPAENVQVGDLLLEALTWPTSMASPSYGGGIGTVLGRMAGIAARKSGYFIERFGRFISGQSQKGQSSIILMEIAQIINSLICNLQHVRSTIVSTTRKKFLQCSQGRSYVRSVLSVTQNLKRKITVNSTAIEPALAFTANVGRDFSAEETGTQQLALSAEKRLLWRLFQREGFIAASGASGVSKTETTGGALLAMCITNSAEPAAACSRSSLVQNRRNVATAVKSVQKIKLAKAEPVYNLEVAPGYMPEFFANGVLVHNSVSRIPLVKLLGISPHGLNATAEPEIRVFYDTIAAMQESFFRKNLARLMHFTMLSLWGEVDKDITFAFEPLWSMDDAAEATVRKTQVETAQLLIDMGVISQEEERQRIAEDPGTMYPGLDKDEMPDLKQEETEGGLVPKGSGAGLRAELEDGSGSEEDDKEPEEPKPAFKQQAAE